VTPAGRRRVQSIHSRSDASEVVLAAGRADGMHGGSSTIAVSDGTPAVPTAAGGRDESAETSLPPNFLVREQPEGGRNDDPAAGTGEDILPRLASWLADVAAEAAGGMPAHADNTTASGEDLAETQEAH
jgi:hypothetical protein